MICNIQSSTADTVLAKFTTENLIGPATVDGTYPVMNPALFDQANQELTEELFSEYSIINKFFTRTGNYAVFHSSTAMLVENLEKNPSATPYPDLLRVEGTVDRALSFIATIDEGRLQDDILIRELPIEISTPVMDMLQELADNGHRTMVVGGAVRDALLGKNPKDIDIEVYNISYSDLEGFLSKIGKTNVVGKAFGVIKFTDPEGNEYDFSIPRRESKTGIGHTGFKVEFDTTMTPKEAARRRDFTWNGLAYDVLKKEIHDYFGGIKDLKEGILRHTSDQFSEDPLRILRAMQFQARMGLDIDPGTTALMRRMVAEGALDNLSKERITEEWMKWATKASFPSKIFNFLLDIGLSPKIPHIGALKGVQQEFDWHPEGDVEIHTGFVMDEAAKIADREGLTGDDRAVLIFSALTHDFAKPMTTEVNIVRGVPRITSRGHEEAGGKLAEEFLKSIGVKQSIIDRVVPLVVNHLAHVSIAQIKAERGKVSATKKLAVKLKDSNISELLYLIEADASGRPPLPKGLPQSGLELRDLSQRIGVSKAVEKPIMSGAYLIERGMTPGRELGDVLRQAAAAQENGEFSDLEGGKQWLFDNFGIPKSSNIKLTNGVITVPDDFSDTYTRDVPVRNFTIKFPDGATASGYVSGVEANLTGINAPRNGQGEVTRGTKTYERVIQQLATIGASTLNVTLQSKDSRAVLDKLVVNGTLTSPRNMRGVSEDQYPVTFTIPSFVKSTLTVTRTPQQVKESRELAKQKISQDSSNKSLIAANNYNRSVGLPPVLAHTYKPSDPEVQSKIAVLYPKLQDVFSPNYKETQLERSIFDSYLKNNEVILQLYGINNYQSLVKEAYAQLVVEVELQWRQLPIKISFHDGDRNYENSLDMLDDVHNFNHLWVFSGGDDHTALGSNTQDDQGLTANDKFRAVHDYFGHSVEGYQFGKDGEENAWIEHSKMFSPLAQWALSSETRGQNSYVNYSGVNSEVLDNIKRGGELKKRGAREGDQSMVAEGQALIDQANANFKFADQKTVLLPFEFTDTGFFVENTVRSMPAPLLNRELVTSPELPPLVIPENFESKC